MQYDNDDRPAATPQKGVRAKAELDEKFRQDFRIRHAGPSDGPRPLRVPNVPLRRSTESK